MLCVHLIRKRKYFLEIVGLKKDVLFIGTWYKKDIKIIFNYGRICTHRKNEE